MRRKRGIGAKILAVVTAVSMFPAAGLTAMAAGTDGVTPPAALDIGHPTFKNTEQLDEVYNLGDVGYDSKQMMKDIYQQDLDNGGDSFYMDRILARYGVANGDPNRNGNNDGNTFMTRGRALYMYTSTPSVIGFGGKTTYGPGASGTSMGGNMYAITFEGGNGRLTAKENTSQRVNSPSNWVSEYTVGELTAKVEKFISNENVAVTTVYLTNPTDAEQTITATAASEFVNNKSQVDISGKSQKELTGTVNSPGELTKITTRLTGEGFDYSQSANNALSKTVTIPAGATEEIKVVMAFTTEELPGSTEDYIRFAQMDGTTALKTQKKEYNAYWAENLPYIDVPNKAIQKAIDYRWWLERFNTADANIPGYDYQYPVTIEGVLGYNNAIALTQPMHLQDTKWLRNAYLPYGQLLSVGNSSQSSAFLDNPGNRSNWNNHYGQYIADAGVEAFNVIGGSEQLAQNLAYYFEHDAKGQIEHYGNHTSATTPANYLIDYRNNYMTGNDADTISMHVSGAGTWKTHGENAYVYAAAKAAAEMYESIGNTAKAKELNTLAKNIQDDILEYLWCDKCQKFETRAVSPSGSFVSHNPDKPNLIELTESNNYNYFAVGAVPTDKESIAKYKEALKTFTNGEEFPIFPYYTANQVHNKTLPGSNNFSNINFTVQARAYEAALRTYDVEQEYVTDDMLALMIEWCAWNMYPDGGDVSYPNNNEFFNIDGRTNDTYYRSWIYHNILGNYTYLFIEDMAGVRPRADEKLELDPIDFSYDHFMVNNIRYHGKDITVSWDDPTDGTDYYGEKVPDGFAVWVDGKLAFHVKDLVHVIYDAKTGNLEFPEGETTEVITKAATSAIPQAQEVTLTDEKVTEMLKKAGINGLENMAEGADVEATYTPAKAREAAWAEKHRADGSDSTSKAVNETAPDPQAVTDGTTVNMPFWGNDQSPNKTDALVIDLGEEKTIDMMDIYFYNDRQKDGYAEPAKYTLEYWDGTQWKHAENQSRTPVVPKANYNEDKFSKVTTSKVRVTVTNQENHYTAITEIQLFNEGGDREVVENQAPQVKVSVDESKAENMKAVLTAECIDDGMPYDKELTYKWEVIGKPEGASAFLLNEQSLNTTLVASAAGAYTVRFTANDGEKSASEELGVEIREMEVSRVDAAVNAKPSSDFTASWENLNGVNDPTFEPSSSNVGTNKGWGNWGCSGGTGSEHWIGYTWNEKVSINELAIYWYDDGGGTRVPRAYRLQYKNDAGEWTDAEILTDIKNASRKNAYNTIEIQPVTTKELRLYVTLSAAGTGIYRFKTYETPAKEIHPVYAATKTGVIPTLPEYVTVVLSTGEMKEQTVRWNEITQEMVAQDGTFEVTGINGTTGDIVTATVIARSDMDKATISTVDAVEVSTIAGNLPYLPKTVKVGYNNGAQDSVSVKVTWPEITLEQVGKPGASFTVEGDVEGTSAKARLTVHVMGDTVDTSKLEEALENAKKYSEKDYTAESYGKLASAIAEAQDLLENPEATNTQINAAVAAINDAIDGLVEKKAQLRSLLAEAKALEPEKYTAESYAVLEEAIKGAEAVIEDSEAADTAIADAVKALQDAMEKLEKVTEAELILHYTFDKQEDITQIKDESASAYTVQVPGLKADDFVEGAAGTALKFRGEDTSFEIPAKADLATSDITLSYWFKRTGTLTGNNSLLWAKNESAYNGNGFYTNYPVGDRYSSFFVVDGFNGFYVAENPNDFLPLNEWTYITVTWDSDKNEGKIYKNGVEQKITTLGSPDTITGTESAVNRIGKNGYSSDAQYPANLQLDDMRIYNGVLPAADVEAMYTEVAVKDVEKAVAEAEAYEESMYTPESYAKLQETIEAAKRFLAGEVTAEGCKAQIQALREAIEGLKIPADKTSLKALIKAAGEMDVTGYTEESAAVFKAALKDAQDVSDDPEASKEDVAAAEAKLLTALAGLERTKEESVDLSMVRILKEAYKDIDTSKYTESSAKTFTDAMAGLDKVLNKENPTQEEADQAASDLLKAAIKLELRQEIPVEETDLTILGILYEAYRDMNLTGYTEETAEVLRDALKAAKSLLESRDATQEEADLAAAQIVKAAAGLQEVPADPEPQPETKPDDTVLRTLVQAYETLDVSSYTEATGTEMVSAQKAAKDLLARADATQAEIDQAAARLINAAANLVVKAAEPVVPEKPALKKGQTFTYKGLKYIVTNPAQGKAQAAVTGAKSKSAKTVVIPPAVTLNGVKCKVTEISAKAFYKFKKLRKVTIGANVTKIGKQAFYGDSALKSLNVRTKSLKSVGSKALKGINKKAVIKVPSSKRAAYKKVLKNKGQSSTVNIK